jgi:DUF4097 and DUF4098 domain-containing protein YvlB
MSEEVIENLFAVQAPARLILGNIRGSVVVSPGEAGEIHVTAVKRTDSGDSGRTEVLMSQDEDGSVRVETRYDIQNAGFFGLNKPCKVDYTVQVPEACSLRISGVSNTTDVSGVKGDAEVRTVSGDLRLRGLNGSLELSSVSGKLQGEGLHGQLRLNTVSGDVRMLECEFTGMDVSTVSGGVEVHSPLQEGELRFKSVSGDVRLVAPGPLACRVISDSMSGRVHTSLPTSQKFHRHGKSEVELGTGGALVRHNSVSGSIYLESSTGDVQPAKPAPQEAAPVEEPSDVLERLARGEISVDQAVELLGG